MLSVEEYSYVFEEGYMTTVIAFGLGMLVGGTFGVLMAGVLMASREEDE